MKYRCGFGKWKGTTAKNLKYLKVSELIEAFHYFLKQRPGTSLLASGVSSRREHLSSAKKGKERYHHWP